MTVLLSSEGERFLIELAQRPTHEWLAAARAYARARRSHMCAEARRSLGAVLRAARKEPADGGG